MTTEQILKQISELSSDTLIATNSGTFGAAEACRVTGSGDGGEWRTYERIDGTRYTTGADPDNAPGYARHFSPASAASRRAQVAALKETLKSSQTAAAQRETNRERLARGWDGYQFIGPEAGQRKLAAMDGEKAIIV